MTRLLALLAWLLLPGMAGAQCIIAPNALDVPPKCGNVSGPSLDLNFLSGALDPRITFTRANCAPSSTCTTDATYTDAPAAAFATYATNAPILNAKGLGLYEARTNSLLNSGAPATQTTASLATGTYVLFCNGTGTVQSAAVTAVGSGFATTTCSAGTFQTITITTLGTVLVTVVGSVNWFDLQLGAFPTPHIISAGAATTRAADVATMLTGPWFSATAGTLAFDFAAAVTGTQTGGLSNGTFAGSLYLTNPNQWISTSGGVNTTAGVGVASNKSAGAYGSSLQRSATNGAVSAPAAIAAPPSPWSTTLVLGSQPWNPGTGTINGTISRVRFWPRALAAGELQGATQ